MFVNRGKNGSCVRGVHSAFNEVCKGLDTVTITHSKSNYGIRAGWEEAVAKSL